MAKLLVVGVLDRIAGDLHVTIPAAGTLVTAYALGLAIGGPILTALTIKLEKKIVLIGASQGLFIAGAFIAGMSVVPPERMGQAIGIVVSGVAVSGALGVPLGTLVGQTLGWRGSFMAIVAGAVVVLIGTVAFIPPVRAISVLRRG